MAFRWKKHPRPTGLNAVGAGIHRASDYRENGGEVLATVYPSGGTWRGPLKGWYFVSYCGGKLMNTCDALVATEAEAKAQAEAFVKAQIVRAK